MSRSCSSFTLVVTALMLIVLCGCGTASSTAELKRGKQQPEQARAPSGAMGNDNPGIDLHCVADRIRNASAPFHWSYKKEVIGVSASDWEANVAPNAITGTFIDSSGTHAIRGLRSRSTSWDSAVMMLTGPLPAKHNGRKCCSIRSKRSGGLGRFILATTCERTSRSTAVGKVRNSNCKTPDSESCAVGDKADILDRAHS